MQTAEVDLLDIDPFGLVADEPPIEGPPDQAKAFLAEMAAKHLGAASPLKRYDPSGPPTGAMIALVPSDADAARLAVPDGEPADELHLTLWYLGKADDIPPDTREGLVNAIRSMVDRRALPQIRARVFGANLWNPDSDNPAVVLAVGDMPEDERPDEQETLGAFRSMMDEAWHDGGIQLDVPPQHSPWAPHICAMYTDDTDQVAKLADRVGPITFDRIRVAFAGENHDIPLHPIVAVSSKDADRGQAKHTPGGKPHNQDSHGNDHGVDVIPGDKLKLAGRFPLADGERLVSSGRIRSGQWDVLTAEIDTPNGREVRLGVIDPSDRRKWTGGPDPARSARVAELDRRMAAMVDAGGDDATDTDAYERLRDERDELAGDSDGFNRTTSLTSAQVAQLRSDIEAGIASARAAIARDERPDSGEFASGVVPGGLDGDVEWRLDDAGTGEQDDWVLWLAVRPQGEGDDWLPEGDDTASFDPKSIKPLLSALGDLSGDLPKSSRRDTQGKHLPGRRVQAVRTNRFPVKGGRSGVAAVIADLQVLRARLSGALRDELDAILAALAGLSKKHGNHDQRSHGRRRSGVLGSVMDDLASLRDKLSDDDRTVLDKAMAKLRNLESSDVDDDDLVEDEPDEEDGDEEDDDSALVMESASGEVTFTPYADGDIEVEWDDGGYLLLSSQSSREVAQAVAEFAELPEADGPPPTPSDRPDWVTDQDSYRRWINQLAEQWAESEAGQRRNGIAGEMTTSDGKWKVARFGGGVTWIGAPDSVDDEDGPGVLQLDDSGEATQFANLLRDAIVIAGPGPQAGKSASKGASMATKSFNPTIKAVGEGTATLKIASFGEVDKDGDVTEPGYFGVQHVQMVPTHDWNHVWIGKGKIYEKADGAYCDVKFNLKIRAAKDWYEAIKFDYENPPSLAEYSYGFEVLPGGSKSGQHQGRQVRYLTPREDGTPGAKVFEVSPVLQGAGTGTRTAGVKAAGRSHAATGAIAPHETKTVSRIWDRTRTENALPDGARPSELRTVYAWMDPDGDPELKASYSFPHHHGIGGPANLRACLLGIAQLNGPDGEQLGEVERKGIYDHLAAHLKDADHEPPGLRTDPGTATKNMRFGEEAAHVLASVSRLIDRASDVVAMRRTKNKAMATGTADLLGWVADDLGRLRALLSQPVEPEQTQPAGEPQGEPTSEEIASLMAASIARINGI